MPNSPLVVPRSADGRNYVCPRESSVVIPDGCIVQGHWTSNVLDGIRVVRIPDQTVVHTCGTVTGLSGKWSGQG